MVAWAVVLSAGVALILIWRDHENLDIDMPTISFLRSCPLLPLDILHTVL